VDRRRARVESQIPWGTGCQPPARWSFIPPAPTATNACKNTNGPRSARPAPLLQSDHYDSSGISAIAMVPVTGKPGHRAASTVTPGSGVGGPRRQPAVHRDWRKDSNPATLLSPHPKFPRGKSAAADRSARACSPPDRPPAAVHRDRHQRQRLGHREYHSQQQRRRVYVTGGRHIKHWSDAANWASKRSPDRALRSSSIPRRQRTRLSTLPSRVSSDQCK